MRFDESFVKTALPQATIAYGTFPAQLSFSVDSRTLNQDDIFIAIAGTRTDGHEYVARAFAAGAAGCIISKKEALDGLSAQLLKNKLVILVADTQQALMSLASAWRAQYRYPVVAITGSVGKTSTKEILSNILRTHNVPFVVSSGTQNTRIGIALNIFKMREQHQIAIFEVGISKRGEMAELARILRPTTAVITMIGHAHMEGLGSLNDIAIEKRDIFKYFTHESIGIINGDQSILASVGYSHPVIKFGYKTINQIQARKVQINSSHSSFTLKIYKEKYPLILRHTHEGIVFNSLAATAAAYLLGVPNKVIVEGLQQPLNVSGRFEERPLKEGKGSIIHDCYNANPESMKAALLALQKIDTKAQKIAVLGDMLELGVNSPFWHRQLGRFLRKVPSLKHVILVGEQVQWTKKMVPVGITVELVANWKDAVTKLQEKLTQDSLVLVKGSRGIALENVVNAFAADRSAQAPAA